MDPVTQASLTRAKDAITLALSKKETQAYSLAKAIQAKAWGYDEKYRRAAAFELECSDELAKRLRRENGTTLLIPGEVLTRPLAPEAMQRAMGSVPGPSGGYLIGVENLGFIEILRNRSVIRNLGCTVVSGLTGNITAAKQTGTVSVTWQAGDGTSVTAGDQVFGQLAGTPKTAIAITDVSEQLLRQSAVADQFFTADLAKAVTLAVDDAAINGAGGAQPIGLKNTPGITTGQEAASATYAEVLAFIQTAGAANAIRGNPGWCTNTAGAIALMQRQRFTSTDTPLWVGSPFEGQLAGIRAMSSEQLASGNLIFGSWEELCLLEWGVLEIAVDTGGTRFNTAQVGIRAMWMVDVMLRYPQAFVVSTNLS